MIVRRRPRLPRTFAAFSNRSYRALWPANFCSLMARWMQMTLLAWMTLELTDSAFLVSLVGFFALAPMGVVGLLSGALADRYDHLRIIRTTQLVALATTVCMAAVLWLGMERFWHAYAAVFFVGVAWSLELPTRRAMIHDLVGSQGVTNALALDSIGMNASNMVGPALAGVLIGLVGVKGGYVPVVGLSLASVILLMTFRRGAASPPNPRRRPMSLDLLVGLRYTLRHRTLLAVVLITIVMNVLFFPYRALIPVMARDVLGVGPDLMGLMDAITGLGASAGAIVIASTTGVRRHGLIFLGGSIAASAMLLCFAFSDNYLASMALLLVMGVSVAGFATMQATVTVLVSRVGMRGRALGVVSLAIGTSPIGSLIVGALAERAGAPTAIAVTAALGLALLLAIGVLMPSIRARMA